MAREQGLTGARAGQLAAYISVIVAAGTILGCVLAPLLAERAGRKRALATYFAVMMVMIVLTWGWIFYLPPSAGLRIFFGAAFVIGLAQGYFALFTLWLPELYATVVRGTGVAFCTTSCRFIGAGVNFAVGWAARSTGTLGKPLACIAVVFLIGLLIIPFARETRGQTLPD
jgi:MFS family permease